MDDDVTGRVVALLWDLLMSAIVIGCAIGSLLRIYNGDVGMATYFAVDAALARLCMVGE